MEGGGYWRYSTVYLKLIMNVSIQTEGPVIKEKFCMGFLDFHVVYGIYNVIQRNYGKYTGISTQLVQDFPSLRAP